MNVGTIGYGLVERGQIVSIPLGHRCVVCRVLEQVQDRVLPAQLAVRIDLRQGDEGDVVD
ncbi:hypothetical protein D3C72_2397820 [compost metagenome]